MSDIRLSTSDWKAHYWRISFQLSDYQPDAELRVGNLVCCGSFVVANALLCDFDLAGSFARFQSVNSVHTVLSTEGCM